MRRSTTSRVPRPPAAGASLCLVVLLAGCVKTAVDDSGDTGAVDSGDTGAVDSGDTGAVDLPGFAVLSLNLHCLKTEGTGFSGNAARFAAIAEAVAQEDVGALALQEACVSDGEDAVAMLVDALEARTGAAWSSEWQRTHTAWAGTPDEAEEGVAILARGALSGRASVEYHAQAPLTRAGLAATLPEALGGLRLNSVHLEVTDAGIRAAQAREAAAWSLVDADPVLDVLVMGDFNDTEGSAAYGALGQMGFADLSDALDPGRIDHAFLHRGADLAATEARLIFDGSDHPVVSDHPGVLVRLDAGVGQGPITTRIDLHADVGWGHWIAVRGSVSPLSWEQGWPATPLASDHWRLVLTELTSGTFEYKALVDDTTWQQGANVQGNSGTDNEATPVF